MTRLFPRLLLGAALGLLSACSMGIVTNPDGYPFPSEEIAPLPAGIRLEVVNGYPAPAQEPMQNHVYADVQQFTETAASILKRELAKKGVAVGPGADKTLQLRVVAPDLGQGFGMMRGLVTLEAKFGATTITAEGEARSGGGAQHVFDAALVKAVTALLKKPELQAWLQQR